MTQSVFYSFHYNDDARRASQVRQMNQFEEQDVVPSNKWEEVKQAGDVAVHRWIDGQMRDKSCVIVLIGNATASRKFINYEIAKAWRLKKGLIGIDIHGLKDPVYGTASPGRNPFDFLTAEDGHPLSLYVTRHSTPAGQDVYRNIQANINSWINNAVVRAIARR